MTAGHRMESVFIRDPVFCEKIQQRQTIVTQIIQCYRASYHHEVHLYCDKFIVISRWWFIVWSENERYTEFNRLTPVTRETSCNHFVSTSTHIKIKLTTTTWQNLKFKVYSKFSNLGSKFLDMREGLNVFLCDMVSGHGHKVCLGLLLHMQLPVVACYRHNNTTSTHQTAHQHRSCLKQPWLNNHINAFYANVWVLLLSLFEALSLRNFIIYHLCMFIWKSLM